MIFHVSLNKAEDGWIVAECPALPGCVSQGKNRKEALANIREAVEVYIEALIQDDPTPEAFSALL